jgi:hypothetical protein
MRHHRPLLERVLDDCSGSIRLVNLRAFGRLAIGASSFGHGQRQSARSLPAGVVAIEAGKDVYCEWPLGRDTDEAAWMGSMGGRRRIPGWVAGPDVAGHSITSKVLVAEGCVGRVLTATMIGCAPN